MIRRPLALALAGALLAAPLALAEEFDPAREDRNFSKTRERQAEHQAPEYQARAREVLVADSAAFAQELARDPERRPAALCTVHHSGCQGDARLYDWAKKTGGTSIPVTFTARSGATLSGHVWAGKEGSAQRPAVVVVNGSVQAPEELYWFAALTLAQQGYVVMTYDPQGQGRSDQTGFGTSAREGFPAQTAGTPFYDGPQDALDFLLSTPDAPYVPRPSRSGASHADKQQRRVASGHDAAHNPLWQVVDPTRIGLAGHSFGASGVSWVGQADPRVDAIVAWDNLCAPASCTATGRPAGPPPAITKPALGLSADYGLVAQKKSSRPEPTDKSRGSLEYSKAGVDTGQLNIRGGTHYEFSYIASNSFPATLRGAHLTAWYTLAWMDKYVKGDRTADARLLTDRWRSDAEGAAVDPDKDGNLFGFYYPSRLDITVNGGREAVCEDLRAGCKALVKKDGEPAGFSYLRSTGIVP